MSEESSRPLAGLPLVYPFATGTCFVLLVLAIAVFADDPSARQFAIYRIVIALGGAGFAVALTGHLQVYFKILKNGYVKAAAAFGVFVILYFFTPPGLISDSAQMESQNIIQEFASNESLRNAQNTFSKLWEIEEYGDKFSRLGKERNEESITAARDLMRSLFTEDDEIRASFTEITSFHSRVFDCVNSGTCAKANLCSSLFDEIEAFKNSYCDRIIQVSDTLNNNLWNEYKFFTENTCKREYLDTYINYNSAEDISNICLPVQCWARNTAPPYPCDVRVQLVPGVGLPSI